MANNNNKDKCNVPHLRFPEFKGEWEKCTLNEVSYFIKERINTDELTIANYISTENMKSDLGGVDTATAIPECANVIRYKNGDILLSNIRPYLKKVWAANTDGGCSADVFVFRANKISSSFLYYVMANDSFINYVMSGAKGVKMPRGDKEQILKYSFSIPTTKEQNKISRMLSLLDERISTQNKIIEDLKKLKSAIVDFTFTNDTKHDRKRIILSDISIKITRRNAENRIGYVLSNSANHGVIPQSEVFDREIANEDNTSNYFVISNNDFVYNPRKSAIAPYGPINKYDGETEGVISPLYLCFKAHDVDIDYLAWYFKSCLWYEYVYKNGDSGVRHDRVSIKDDIFFSMPLYIHNTFEQRKIVHRMNWIEQFVRREERYLTLLHAQKSYLLQQMFI